MFDTLQWWKQNESRFPELATIARDILAVPAASTGVERLFNQARDFVSYRRHHLKGDTIRLLMMLLALDRYNLRQSLQQIEISEEWEEVGASLDDSDDTDMVINTGYISDTNEDDEESIFDIGPIPRPAPSDYQDDDYYEDSYNSTELKRRRHEDPNQSRLDSFLNPIRVESVTPDRISAVPDIVPSLVASPTPTLDVAEGTVSRSHEEPRLPSSHEKFRSPRGIPGVVSQRHRVSKLRTASKSSHSGPSGTQPQQRELIRSTRLRSQTPIFHTPSRGQTPVIEIYSSKVQGKQRAL